MKKMHTIFSAPHLLFAIVMGVLFFTACKKDDDNYEQTRLFRPVLNGLGMTVENNVITLNLGRMKEATSYTIEISRDSFKLVDYTVTIDTNYVVLDEALLGEGLLYNTSYQLRATANAADPQFNSKSSDLGTIRTMRFPSVLNTPRSFDVTDTRAKITWAVSGAAVTGVKIFSPTDVRLTTPLKEFNVSASDQAAGETIITGLTPSTEYQVAIYSGTTLRGWVNYTTLVPGVDVNAPNVIDLSESEDPTALTAALAAVPEGGIILLKKGFRFNLPTAAISKSVTFKGAYGFSETKAALVNTSGNMTIATGSNIAHIVFDDLEIDGQNISGSYVFNPTGALTQVQELRFENCNIHHMRGIIRIRDNVFIRNYIISNSIVHHIGGYSVLTADTDGADKAAFGNVKFLNSTFYKINSVIQTRQNLQSFEIESCTFNEFTSGGAQFARFRGPAGFNNVTNGISIKNSIFGHGWDETGTQNTTVTMKSGLPSTTFTITNVWGTSDLKIAAGSEIPGLPGMTYNNTASKLWGDPYNGIFSILDPTFAGKYDSGAPVWRTKL
ncbi:DUF4957 domain-containing protein [Niabella yanshanensis]|uniref:DUF4957 domain-containing protein n=1 Tax=Niabella yanshanensis TaxID=577386 RepID=A0ABZ0VZM8_9BACT|nr:DUF4957 domain-containing protein [Niabella yanshanensis]WQD36397.1 DUF4957 domain-containing protein [Niabella yanshanensis]